MYRIGEFSILMDVSIKTLRYYDSINLFKPEVIDKYTGYRYYEDKQINDLRKILKYKDYGLSLNEIKSIINNENSEEVIKGKIDELTTEIVESETKIKMLKAMLNSGDMNVEFKPYHEKYKIGKRYTIASRDEFKEKLKIIKEELDSLNIEVEDEVFCNFELGYAVENIDCFIGYTLKENKILNEIGDLEIITNSKNIKELVGTGKRNEVNELYKKMISYAHDNNIQIRGFFVEVYDGDNLTIYVESFDLNEVNDDYLHYLNNHKIVDEIDEKLIGRYTIREILPSLKYMANPDKQKSMLDTNFKDIVLNDDGTTNYENIKWNKKELLMNYDNTIIPLPIYVHHYNGKKYLEILMNETYDNYKSQRPLSYLYEAKE